MVRALFEDGSLVLNGAPKLTQPLTRVRVPATAQAVLASLSIGYQRRRTISCIQWQCSDANSRSDLFSEWWPPRPTS
jgi:hypothetical protein